MMPCLPQTLKFQNCLEGPPGWFSWQSGEHPSARCSDPWPRKGDSALPLGTWILCHTVHA